MQKPNNIIRHELIGLQIEVTDSKNKDNIGLKGTIIDETKQTLKIKTNNKEKIIIKDQTKFKIKLSKETIEIDGKLLFGKPEVRLKKQIPKKRV